MPLLHPSWMFKLSPKALSVLCGLSARVCMSNSKYKTDFSFQSTQMCQWLLFERRWLNRSSPVGLRCGDARSPKVQKIAVLNYQHLFVPSVPRSFLLFYLQVINHENPLPPRFDFLLLMVLKVSDGQDNAMWFIAELKYLTRFFNNLLCSIVVFELYMSVWIYPQIRAHRSKGHGATKQIFLQAGIVLCHISLPYWKKKIHTERFLEWSPQSHVLVFMPKGQKRPK